MAKSTKTSSPFDRFTKADQPLKHRIFGRSAGEFGSGKTHFWLGAPGPIVLVSFDKGLEGVVEKFQDDKEIYVAEYDWRPTDTLDQQEAIDLRDKVIDDLDHAFNTARTVIIDKETDLWELFRYAEFGSPKDAPLNYPALNQRYRALVNQPKSLDCNVGFIQSMKSKWVAKINKKTGAEGAKDSGDREAAGFKELEGLVHVNIQHSWRATEDGPEFVFDIGKVRGPATKDVQGKQYENLNFREFAMLVFPDSDESDWV